MRVSIEASVLAPADLIAVGVPAGGAVPAELEAAFPVAAVLAEEEFKGKAGSTVVLRTLGKLPAPWLVVVGTGDGGVVDTRFAAGAVGSIARDKGLRSVRLGLAGGAAQTRAAVEGAAAGNYRYDKFKPAAERKAALEQIVLAGVSGGQAAIDAGLAVARAQSLTRDLVNAPAAEVYPQTLADAAAAHKGGRTTIEIWDHEKVRAAGMGGVTAVGQGSDKKPVFVHMVYTPAGTPKGEVAIIGKGVTFDAGGLSIKPTDGMLTMRCDMGGAGAVVGIMSALEALGVQVKVHGIFAAAENMLSGNSYKLGDVLSMYDGQTVEILNTDAEGRLLLADCLAYASKLPVSHVIDMATLTGAAVVALGEHYTALYANTDAFAAQLDAAAKSAGEAFWRMPLEPLYEEKIKADWGQYKNTGGRDGGSITAALFLQHFVSGGKTWAHLDIAGPAFISAKERHLQKGATGHPVASVLAWLESFGG